jgi:hypothetical protein
MIENYEELANAIVVQAVVDYRIAKKRLEKHPLDKMQRHTQREVLRFFRSDWFGILTTLDPEVIIEKLAKEGAE